MSERACPECARRGLLLADLAANVDKVVGLRAGDRARDLLALSDPELAAAVAPQDAPARVRRAGERASMKSFGPRLRSLGCWSACAHAGGLPSSLAALGASAPHALYGTGDRELVAGLDPLKAVTIVGSRRSTGYGREVAHEMARLLSAAGIVVVSGLALGIDSAAHEGALEGGGPTIAVLGPGADRAYPRSRSRLYRRIREHGAVVSELPPGAPTFRWMFPARNRLMAAMAGVTVVVEAAERSGSLITAEMAIEGGAQVGAVPGPVTAGSSSGTNRLLAEGAAVVRDAQDVLDLLLGPGAVEIGSLGPPLAPTPQAVLEAVAGGAATADAIASGTGVPFTEALMTLASLERDGYVFSDATGRYGRTARMPPNDPL